MKEVGIDVPEDHTVHVHEAAPDEHHLVIPPKPVGELSDEDLDKVSGGLHRCRGGFRGLRR